MAPQGLLPTTASEQQLLGPEGQGRTHVWPLPDQNLVGASVEAY